MKNNGFLFDKRKHNLIINVFLTIACTFLLLNSLLQHEKFDAEQNRNIQQQELYTPRFIKKNPYQQFQQIFADWDDAFTIADGTTSKNLDEPIHNLKLIRRAALILPTPSSCFVAVKNKLIQSMNVSIDQFSSMMANQIVFRTELNLASKLQLQAVNTYKQCLMQ